MKKVARAVLIVIIACILGGVLGCVYTMVAERPVYTSTAKLYVDTGDSESKLRANDGGLVDDFAIIFASPVVIQDVQKTLGTQEDISKYISVNTPPNSNVIELICTYPDQNTAKSYVDAVAMTAIKTTSIVKVGSIQILSEGDSTGQSVRPNLRINAIRFSIVAAVLTAIIVVVVSLLKAAFKPEEDADRAVAKLIPRLERLEKMEGITADDLKNAADDSTSDLTEETPVKEKSPEEDELVQYMKAHRKKAADEDAYMDALDDELSGEQETPEAERNTERSQAEEGTAPDHSESAAAEIPGDAFATSALPDADETVSQVAQTISQEDEEEREAEAAAKAAEAALAASLATDEMKSKFEMESAQTAAAVYGETMDNAFATGGAFAGDIEDEAAGTAVNGFASLPDEKDAVTDSADEVDEMDYTSNFGKSVQAATSALGNYAAETAGFSDAVPEDVLPDMNLADDGFEMDTLEEPSSSSSEVIGRIRK